MLARPRAAAPVVAPSDDGCCCCCGRQAPRPPSPGLPAPRPPSPLGKGCCCADRNATKPACAGDIAPAPDALPVPEADAPAPLVSAPVAAHPDYHSPPANLLHRVWLC